MSLRQIKVNGRKVWQARVAYQGLRKSTIRPTRDEARQAEADLLTELKVRVGKAEQDGARPVTVKQLLEFYAADMQARGKGEESVSRVEYTALAVERLTAGLLNKPVSAVSDRDIFALREARAREETKPSTINRDLDPPGRAQEGAARVPLPRWGLLPRGRDTGPVAPARGGASRPGAHAVAVP